VVLARTHVWTSPGIRARFPGPHNGLKARLVRLDRLDSGSAAGIGCMTPGACVHESTRVRPNGTIYSRGI
jgi:hypothetical protein